MTSTKMAALSAISVACLLTACASPSVVTTNDGKSTYTDDTPDTESDKDFIIYEKNGDEVKVNKSDIRKIEPAR